MDPKALYMVSYGLYIVSTRVGEKRNGQVANTLFQVTSEPKRIALSINKENYTYELIKESGIFTASILSEETSMDLIARFGFRSGRDIDKFQGTGFKNTPNGIPYIEEDMVAYIEGKVIDQMDAGTHVIFLGDVTGGELLEDGEPMTYSYYHKVKKGKAPKNAPTYRGKEESSSNGEKYECTICGYIYDPEKGDPESGINPGTPFEKLPGDWICPLCGAPKKEFKKI